MARFLLLLAAATAVACRGVDAIHDETTGHHQRQPSHLSALFHNLFGPGYEAGVKPDGKVDVKVGVQLVDIGLCPVTETFKTTGWLTMMWTDSRLAWNDTFFGGVNKIQVDVDRVWVPDVTPYNAVGTMDGNQAHWTKSTKVVVMSSGTVLYIPPVTTRTHCTPDYAALPFGEQNCTLVYGSWTHEMTQIDVNPMDNHMEPIATDHFMNSLTTITGTHVEREETEYPCCPGQLYPSLQMSVTFKKTGKYDRESGNLMMV